MIIYLSLPISGKCELKQRATAKMFQRYFEALRHEVVNPFNIYDKFREWKLRWCGIEPINDEIITENTIMINRCSHIFLCNGWSESNGCITEAEKAVECGIKFLFERTYKF